MTTNKISLDNIYIRSEVNNIFFIKGEKKGIAIKYEKWRKLVSNKVRKNW